MRDWYIFTMKYRFLRNYSIKENLNITNIKMQNCEFVIVPSRRFENNHHISCDTSEYVMKNRLQKSRILFH